MCGVTPYAISMPARTGDKHSAEGRASLLSCQFGIVTFQDPAAAGLSFADAKFSKAVPKVGLTDYRQVAPTLYYLASDRTYSTTCREVKPPP